MKNILPDPDPLVKNFRNSLFFLHPKVVLFSLCEILRKPATIKGLRQEVRLEASFFW